MPKSANLNGIKSLYSYTVQEAADISGVSERTIRAWIKDGLQAMTQDRPILIRGDALIAFIKAQRNARKRVVRQDEFYCLKCRAARKPAGNFVVCKTDGSRAKLTAFCDVCETIMHKPVALDRVALLSKVFDLTVQDDTKTAQSVAAD